jgi:hypothetical protein
MVARTGRRNLRDTAEALQALLEHSQQKEKL